MFHFGCAYAAVTDKVKLPNTDCKDLWVHVAFMNPFTYIIFFVVLAKIIQYKRQEAKLRASTVISKGPAPAAKQGALEDLEDLSRPQPPASQMRVSVENDKLLACKHTLD